MRIPCPTCGRMKPEFAIRDGRCRDDIADEERGQKKPHVIDWNDIRAERTKRLTACDWTQVADAKVANQDEWATYRQALRDVTTTFAESGPENVVWPTPPQ